MARSGTPSPAPACQDWSKAGEPPDSTVCELFHARAGEQPDAPAVACGDRRLTYRQLDERAGRLAALLASESGVAPGSLVAVIQDRAEHALVSILAVLKAGAAYVPLNPDDPDDRLRFALSDSRAKAILVSQAHAERVTALTAPGVLVHSVDGERAEGRLAGYEPAPGPGPAQPGDLAYVIYTSGTTGRPKGVMVEHRSVVNYIRNVAARIGLRPSDICGYSTNLSFDLTVTTTVACLALGGQVAVYPESTHDLAAYRRFLIDRQVTFIKLPPAYFGLIADGLDATAVRTVVLGGEKLRASILRRVATRPGQDLRIFDEYGPTEATVGACLGRVFPLPSGELNLGTAYDGCDSLVLDERGREVAPGEIGELYLGGRCLARGYLNQPELTAERFAAAPGVSADGDAGRLYKTGDLVRALPGGELEYIGRNDLQVKIRGYRVELEEIADAIARHGDVEQAVVAAFASHEDQAPPRLVGYVVPGEFGCSAAELDEHMRRCVPDYMLPLDYVFLDELPLTSNGKVDRTALAKPVRPGAAIAPRSEAERAVHELWADLLKTGGVPVGVTDDFFQAGGDSIVAIQLIGRIRTRFGVQVSAAEILSLRTIERLSELIESRSANALACAAAADAADDPLTGTFPLLPIQRWFFDQGFPRADHWNQAFLIRTPRLDVERLRAAVTELGRRHGALRFRRQPGDDGRPGLGYGDDFEPTPLATGTAGSPDELQETLTSWQRDFRLAGGPLYRIGYVEGFADGTARVFVACHHLAVDAISWRVLAEDLQCLYEGRPLPPVGSSYRQWVHALLAYPDEHVGERRYWAAVRDAHAALGEEPLLSLVESRQARTESGFELDRGTTALLLRECNRAYRTQINDLLLAAFAHALADLTGRRENYVILEGHGREDIGRVDVGRTVGWFTTMFPVRLEAGASLTGTVRNTKEMLRALPAKGVGYGAFFGYSNSELPRINFNYLGQLSADSAGAQWRITGEPAGVCVHPDNLDGNVMTINGMVVDGKLRFTFVTKLRPDAAERAASCYQRRLTDLISELADAERGFLTQSDVHSVVSAEYLEEIQAGREIDDVLLANSLQEGFILHAVTRGRSDDAYIVQMLWSYASAIEADTLRWAWEMAQRRFATLRVRFGWKEDLVQIIDSRADLDWRHSDLSGLDAAEQDSAVDRMRASDRAEPYDLGAGALFRVYLLKRAAGRYTCLFSHHHSILDGWSITLLLDYVHETYLSALRGERAAAGAEAGYVAGQRYLQEHVNESADFWRGYLSDRDERGDLQALLHSGARARGVQLSAVRHFADMRELRFAVAGSRRERLDDLVRRHGITTNALFLYLWTKCLDLFGGGRVVTGVVMSGRGLPVAEIESAVGLFINTVPLVAPAERPTEAVVDGIRAVQALINDFSSRGLVNLASLSEGPGRLFDSLFIYENWPKIGHSGWQRELASHMDGEYEKLDYPLDAVISETAAEIGVRLCYAADHIDGRHAAALLQTLEHLLDMVLLDPDRPSGTVPLLDTAGALAVEAALNPSPRELTGGLAFHRRFERQALRTPGATAVAAGGRALTYGDLNSRANQLAAVLAGEHGVRPGDTVLLCLERDHGLLVSILAVLKAGAAYVPLSPSLPDERIGYILADTGSAVVLTLARHEPRLAGCAAAATLAGAAPASVVALDDEAVASCLARASAADPGRDGPSSELMYVLYTSGTTGQPKGVMVEHRSYAALLDAVRSRHFADAGPISTFSVTSHTFDIFGLEFGLPLITGGFIELATEMPAALDCRPYDFIQMTPSACDLLIDRLHAADGTLLLVGGERLQPDLLHRIHARSLDVAHVYGPTETTIWSTSRLFRHTEPVGPVVGLGGPFDGERIHILDGSMRPVPRGAAGELCVSGVGLARGYWRRPELTAERFRVARLPGDAPGQPTVVYRTGDLVRLQADGELEFLGRNDHQVKIRGHRIELGEVEAALGAAAGVRRCAVLARPTARQEQILVGYCVSDGTALDFGEIEGELRARIPDYLIPTAFVQLDDLPLTPNGKLDHAALPSPGAIRGRAHVPPRSDLDEAVRACLATLLDQPADDIGIDDDFFELGGSSVLAIKLAGLLNGAAGLAADVPSVLANRTVRRIVDNLGAIPPAPKAIPRCGDPARGRLSLAQERLWFIEQFENGTTAYNLPLVLEIGAGVDQELLARCAAEVIGHHDALRTLVKTEADGSAYQVVTSPDAAAWSLAPVVVADRAQLRADITAELGRVFDLASELPVRVRMYAVADSGLRYLSFIAHHIAFDGWSAEILVADLASRYRSAAAGQDAVGGAPAPAPVTYLDYAQWQRDRLSGQMMSELEAFWHRKLRDYSNLSLALDRPRPERKDHRGANMRAVVDPEVCGRLRALARELNVSLFSVLVSAYFLTLHCFSGQDDVVIGTPAANRDHPELEHLIGFLANTLPLRSRLEPAESVPGYIIRIAGEVADLASHQELPLEHLVDSLNVPRDASRHPIFQAVFGLQNFGRSTANQDVLIVAPETEELFTAARFDLSMFIDDTPAAFQITFNYATSLFDAATIASATETFLHVLGQFAALAQGAGGPEPVAVSDLEFLSERAFEEIVRGLGRPAERHEPDGALHELFERQAALSAERTALACAGARLSYAELNAAANRLAHHLIEDFAVGLQALVVVCLDRNEHLAAAILGVLKAGAAYVPIDPATPDDRSVFILRDCGARIVITERRHAERFAAASGTSGAGPSGAGPLHILVIDEEPTQAALARRAETNPGVRAPADSLAYVIYTSGTTGQPKGVLQTHANVVRLFAATRALFSFGADDVWTMFHSFAFDFTIWEIWGAWLHGGRLVIPTFEQTRDPQLFFDLCEAEAVTVLCQTPSSFYQFAETAAACAPRRRLTALRYVIFGGEALNLTMLAPWRRCHGDEGPRLVNMFGITETTVHVTYKELGAQDRSGPAGLGAVLPDMCAYVVDSALRPLPVGAVGELFVGGAGLARGYLNRPELTRERFPANPFEPQAGDRLYRSGDLVRWTAAGELEYLGRNDLQVKIRGHRIELGEVESVLSELPGVSRAVVVARRLGSGADPASLALVGYYVPEESGAEREALLGLLRRKLPGYMVPSALVELRSIPRTVNGKLDADALPTPALAGDGSFTAPRDAMEEFVRDAMASVLGLAAATVGAEDDFFALGGNSILSVKLASALGRGLGADVSVASLFANSTVAALARQLRRPAGEPRPAEPIKARDSAEPILSSMQEALWFIDCLEQGTNAYNIQLCYELAPGADLDRLERSIRHMAGRHDVLRTVIRQNDDGEPYQLVLGPAEQVVIERVAVSSMADLRAALAARAAASFDLAAEFPFRAALYALGDRQFAGFLTHHIAFDGWSAGLLASEIEECYRYYSALAAGQPAELGLRELAIQYRDYAAWQRAALDGPGTAESIRYWLPRLAGRDAAIIVPDRPGAGLDHRGAALPFRLSPGVSQGLRRLARQTSSSLHSVLLAGFCLTLAQVAGSGELVIGMPALNRRHSQTHDLIGCFVNTLAVDFSVDARADITEVVRSVAARVRDAMRHEDLPFDRLVDALGRAGAGRRRPFQVWFDLDSFGRLDGPLPPGEARVLRRFDPAGDETGRRDGVLTQMELSVVLNDDGDLIDGAAVYAASLFDEPTIEEIVGAYLAVLARMARQAMARHTGEG